MLAGCPALSLITAAHSEAPLCHSMHRHSAQVGQLHGGALEHQAGPVGRAESQAGGPGPLGALHNTGAIACTSRTAVHHAGLDMRRYSELTSLNIVTCPLPPLLIAGVAAGAAEAGAGGADPGEAGGGGSAQGGAGGARRGGGAQAACLLGGPGGPGGSGARRHSGTAHWCSRHGPGTAWRPRCRCAGSDWEGQGLGGAGRSGAAAGCWQRPHSLQAWRGAGAARHHCVPAARQGG